MYFPVFSQVYCINENWYLPNLFILDIDFSVMLMLPTISCLLSFIENVCVFFFFHLLVDKRRQLLNFWIAVFFESNIINKFMYQLILFNSLFLFLSFERFKLDFLQSVYWLVYLMVFLKFVASFYLMPACKYWFVWWSLNSSLFSLSVFPIC